MQKEVWLITGISSGIGKATAELAMEQGAYVVGTLRREEQVLAFNEQNKGRGEAHLVDVTQADQLQSLVETVLEKHNKIDVLVNNAGYGMAGAIEETSMEEVRKLFEANFFGALYLTQLVLPAMRKARQGKIIQISSHGGFKAFPGFGIYNASKFALEGFSEALASEVAPLGIKVHIVEPGPFRTNFAGNGFAMAANKIEDYKGTSGAFREKIKSVDGMQEGDPAKAAQVIVDLVSGDIDVLRLPLGKIALLSLQAKLDSVQADMEQSRSLAESAVY